MIQFIATFKEEVKTIIRIIKMYTTCGFRKALRNLWREAQICRIHRRNIRYARRYDRQENLRLHFGCGPRIRPGWVNIDLSAAQADLHR